MRSRRCRNGGKAWPFHAGPATAEDSEPFRAALRRVAERVAVPAYVPEGLLGAIRAAAEREAEITAAHTEALIIAREAARLAVVADLSEADAAKALIEAASAEWTR